MNIAYKYYPANNYSFDAIKNKYFFFNKMSLQNDPYDASLSLIPKETLDRLIKLGRLTHKAGQIISNYATCSFSKSSTNKHLWAHYADNYSGFAIGFDEENLHDFYFDKLQIRVPYATINYIDTPLRDDNQQKIIDENPLNINGWEHLTCNKISQLYGRDYELTLQYYLLYIYSLKEKKTWKIEEEKRLIAMNDIVEKGNRNRNLRNGIQYLNNGYKLPMPIENVKEIIVGTHFKDENLPLIIDFANGCPYVDCIKRIESSEPFKLELTTIWKKQITKSLANSEPKEAIDLSNN